VLATGLCGAGSLQDGEKAGWFWTHSGIHIFGELGSDALLECCPQIEYGRRQFPLGPFPVGTGAQQETLKGACADPEAVTLGLCRGLVPQGNKALPT